ncbi:DcuS/MalK family sensor histidine kinase [Bacillus sp. SG-1]|uniref:DcuS/MalK family sensor histidine kinase n=1 Tax=Bacillus sp. SG-1 TaxID=161544 RepID=UPI00015434AB|nr:DcuS/MalK family sensor histidine kinase [Bacillus sp. SG-1]EDL66123.1 two-component sensor histidine kinase [Bacillus sp. SG-1]
MRKRQFKLSTIIIVFVCLVVLSSLLVTDLLISNTTTERIRDNQEEKAQIVSRTVAESQIVKEGLLSEEKAQAIQGYTSEVQTITDMMFIVVMDMEGIRKSHPNPQMIGKSFVGGDEKEVLKGNEHISVSKGTLGDSLRAFTPVYDDNHNQIGAVAVGISLEQVESALSLGHKNIIMGTVLGILAGIIGAVLLARYIKKMLFGLEPYAISKLLEERSTMLQSVHEGIVAVDHEKKITLVNKSALRIFKMAGLSGEPIGMKISDYMPSSKLDRVLLTGKPERDEELILNGVSVLVNREPLIVNNRVIGAISTFRDMTEVNHLAKQLTGIRTYAETLRAQSHEFMNRLHVIFGMVQLEAYDELMEYIRKLVAHNNQEIDMVTKSITDPVLAGFLMGKISYAREENVELTVKSDSTITSMFGSEITHELITIIGNLIDNAIEAVTESEEKRIDLRMKDVDGRLYITVKDSGPGIDEEKKEAIFKKGYSTKGYDRGFGLYLVRKSIEKLNGKLTVDSRPGGTVFDAVIVYDTKRDGIEND